MNIINSIILILGSTGGALITFLLQKHLVSAVVASCLVGLLGAFLEFVFHTPHLALVVFAGSFVGMTSANFGTVPLVLISGGLAGIVYIFSLKIFPGFGGKLGSIAFLSTTIVFYILSFFKK